MAGPGDRIQYMYFMHLYLNLNYLNQISSLLGKALGWAQLGQGSGRTPPAASMACNASHAVGLPVPGPGRRPEQGEPRHCPPRCGTHAYLGPRHSDSALCSLYHSKTTSNRYQCPSLKPQHFHVSGIHRLW